MNQNSFYLFFKVNVLQ